mmetsp:Transcript_15030/g.38120  ORF Transcript_15030/g.38120 Transcript_15030/m.38120 type:complete len:268 (+) Transcript_15030:226-1029(+)|eukprot:CAMPEP_0177656918 /NCGR_PEP_ID=MMETSP0447-20121125/15869_1 /TAXON_ID=0 /ORGANISM="Stygamoeba regulata, Strain BSH-02190019" /LENGTH=267 /DNA_ID=CAMNT_0019161161 /DNA_START=129 /DNA_END=932 /DNA_ORIENTATION=-
MERREEVKKGESEGGGEKEGGREGEREGERQEEEVVDTSLLTARASAALAAAKAAGRTDDAEFIKIDPARLPDVLAWLREEAVYNDLLVVGEAPRNAQAQPLAFTSTRGDDFEILDVPSDVTTVSAGDDEWVLLDASGPSFAPVCCAEDPPPDFQVARKMRGVWKLTTKSLFFGYTFGSQLLLQSLFHHIVQQTTTGKVAVAAALSGLLSPTLLLTAAEVVVVCGLVGAALTTVPVFVIGTSGVFLSAAVFHAYHAAKRGVHRLTAS